MQDCSHIDFGALWLQTACTTACVGQRLWLLDVWLRGAGVLALPPDWVEMHSAQLCNSRAGLHMCTVPGSQIKTTGAWAYSVGSSSTRDVSIFLPPMPHCGKRSDLCPCRISIVMVSTDQENANKRPCCYRLLKEKSRSNCTLCDNILITC